MILWLDPVSSLVLQAFVDLAFMKLDHARFDEPIDPNESSNLRGSFAKVVKRNFDTHVSILKHMIHAFVSIMCVVQHCLLCT